MKMVRGGRPISDTAFNAWRSWEGARVFNVTHQIPSFTRCGSYRFYDESNFSRIQSELFITLHRTLNDTTLDQSAAMAFSRRLFTGPSMVIVFNPVAGRRRAHLLWRVLDVLVANGVRLDLAETHRAGHAEALARRR